VQSVATTLLPLRFSSLYRENFAFVRAAIRRLGVPSWLEDDAVQDVFIVAHRHLADFAGDGLEGWLLVIARRIAFRHRRSATRQRRKLDALRMWLGLGAAEKPWQAIEARMLLGEMTQRLGREQHEAFEWCEVRGYTAMEAALELGLNPNTVSTRLRAARLELRRALVDAPVDRTPPTRAAFARGWLLLWPRLVTGSWWPITQAGIWASASALLVATGIATVVPQRATATAAALPPVADAHATAIHANEGRVPAPPAEVPTIATSPAISTSTALPTPTQRRIEPVPASPEPALALLGAEQLADAWLAFERGELDVARRLVLEHRSRHPSSPLEPERARLLTKLDATR